MLVLGLSIDRGMAGSTAKGVLRFALVTAVAYGALSSAGGPAAAQQRVLGIDVSAWQGNLSQTTWNNLHNINDRDFVFIRSSRGGTTGFYNQSDPSNNNNQNTLSQRYDDPYFVQNITRATSAGMFAGPYHFARPDIIASTQNAGGSANTGADEADHFMEMAGAWMRPGYLLPAFDLEAGQSQRTSNELAQFSIDFSNRIHEVMGIRPVIYTNGNYANYLQGASSALEDAVVAAFPTLWSARWPNQSNPDAIPVQTGHPKDTYTPIYGPWDDAPNPTHPWSFWQYASTARLSGYNNGNSNIDVNVAQGGMEFLKDQLVPALWTADQNGQWTTLANWNSGQTPVPPVQGPGQVPRVGPLTLPAERLPSADDTVILDRPNADITVTLASGVHNIRKLEVREALNITGGSLTINYVPAAESTPIAAQFSAPVALSGGSLSVHTLQVDATQSFSLAGTLTFATIQLLPHGSAPARIAVLGDVNFNPLDGAAATIVNGAGAGNSGLIDLGGANRAWQVADGAAAVDLSVNVPVVNGALTKTGTGTLALTGANTYTGGTTIEAGTLLANNTIGSATGSGAVQVNNSGRLGGSGSITGPVTVAAGGILAPGTSPGLLTVGDVTFDFGSTFAVEVTSTAFDQLVVSNSATLGGDLVVDLADSFVPDAADALTILAATALTDSFANVLDGGRLDTGGGEGSFLVSYDGTTNAVVLSDFALLGDMDGDGDMDFDDIDEFVLGLNNPQAYKNQFGVPAELKGDIDRDGDLDFDDIDDFVAVLIGPLSVGTQTIPEPGTGVLLGVAISALAFRRWRW